MSTVTSYGPYWVAVILAVLAKKIGLFLVVGRKLLTDVAPARGLSILHADKLALDGQPLMGSSDASSTNLIFVAPRSPGNISPLRNLLYGDMISRPDYRLAMLCCTGIATTATICPQLLPKRP